MGGRHRLPRRVERDARLMRDLLQPRPGHRAPRSRPRRQGPLPERLLRIRHDQLRRESEHVTESAAGRAHAERAVEREQRRLGPHRRLPAVRALPALTPPGRRGACDRELQPALSAPERLLACLDQALALPFAPPKPVHDHAHLARPLPQARRRIERDDIAPDPCARVAGAQQVARLLLPGEPLGERDRRQDEHGLVLAPVGRLAGDGLGRVGGHHPTAVAAMDAAQAGEQEPQVVVDLGGGGHGAAGAARRGALLDAHGRGQPRDRVHVGAWQPVEELLRVRAHRLHVAPLPLGVERVERQRGLPRARHAGDHRQRTARNVQVHAAEVVLAGASDADGGDGFGSGRGHGSGGSGVGAGEHPAWEPPTLSWRAGLKSAVRSCRPWRIAPRASGMTARPGDRIPAAASPARSRDQPDHVVGRRTRRGSRALLYSHRPSQRRGAAGQSQLAPQDVPGPSKPVTSSSSRPSSSCPSSWRPSSLPLRITPSSRT